MMTTFAKSVVVLVVLMGAVSVASANTPAQSSQEALSGGSWLAAGPGAHASQAGQSQSKAPAANGNGVGTLAANALTVPEPSSFGLYGVAMLMVLSGAAVRRRKVKNG